MEMAVDAQASTVGRRAREKEKEACSLPALQLPRRYKLRLHQTLLVWAAVVHGFSSAAARR